MVGEVGPLHDLPDPLPRRDVLGGTVELAVVYRAEDHGLELERSCLKLYFFTEIKLQRSKKWLVHGLVKFATAVARLVCSDLLG